MGTNERRKREKANRRNAILDAAEAIFFKKSVEQSSMDEVAKKAELSKGTLYLYFHSKEELFHGIVHRGLTILLDMFQKVALGDATGIEKIRDIGRAYFHFSESYPDYAKSMLHHEKRDINLKDLENNPNMAKCNADGSKIFTIMQDILLEGIKDGTIDPTIDPVRMSMVLWAHASGIMNLIQMKGDLIKHLSGVDKTAIMEYSMQMHSKSLIPPHSQSSAGESDEK